MNNVSITNGPVGEALGINVHTDINQALHQQFVVRYSTDPADNIIFDLANMPAMPLQSSQLLEVWDGLYANNTNQNKDWQIYYNDKYLFAAVPIFLLENLTLDQAAEKAYSLIFEQMQHWGYPYLLRTWNFFPEITSGAYADANNYHLFCSGRAKAYTKLSTTHAQPYPAATVIGIQQSGLYIYFIASKENGVGIENPQQVSAFEYPPAYSQDPPLFSRALLHRNESQEILFVSGTASIAGHSTQYEGDVNRQTTMCLDNINNLVSASVNNHHFPKISLSEFSHFKVYIKNIDHLDTVRTHIQQLIGVNTPTYYLQGDMCRADLLVEVEGLAIISRI